MAKAVLTLEDDGPGRVDVRLEFHPVMDESSAAHRHAAELLYLLGKQQKLRGDDGEPLFDGEEE